MILCEKFEKMLAFYGAPTLAAVSYTHLDVYKRQGFADANLYLTHLPEAYREAYPTAIAVNMKKLGYETCFWYAGPNSWERIHDFALAQGFDKFYGRGDYGETEGNVWGLSLIHIYCVLSA